MGIIAATSYNSRGKPERGQGLYKEFKFQSIEKKNDFASFLKNFFFDLYKKNFDPQLRTIFIRDTGDNFRACSKYPTEQTSYSILNIAHMVNCLYGQFISTLWHDGSESREMVTTHVKLHYDEITYSVHNSVGLQIDGSQEKFNIDVFFGR